MLFKEQPKSSMEEEIFEQAEVLENLLSTHLDGNNIIFEVPAEVKKSCACCKRLILSLRAICG